MSTESTKPLMSLYHRAELALEVAEYHTGYPVPELGKRDTHGVRGLAAYLLKQTGPSWPEVCQHIYGHITGHGTAMHGSARWLGKVETAKALVDYLQRIESR